MPASLAGWIFSAFRASLGLIFLEGMLLLFLKDQPNVRRTQHSISRQLLSRYWRHFVWLAQLENDEKCFAAVCLTIVQAILRGSIVAILFNWLGNRR